MAEKDSKVIPAWKLNAYMKTITGMGEKEIGSGGAYVVHYLEPFKMSSDNVEVICDGNAIKISVKQKNPSYDWS